MTCISVESSNDKRSFFRGTKDQLIGASGLTVTDPTKETYSVLVKQKGKIIKLSNTKYPT